MQHDEVLSLRQKAAATKIALEAIFVVCLSDSIKKTEKDLGQILTQQQRLMSQYLQVNVTTVTGLLCHVP